MQIIKFTLSLLLFAIGLQIAGCTPVEPWQRGILAKPQMALEPQPLQSIFRNHNYGSREAAAGGGAAKGGGCGCY